MSQRSRKEDRPVVFIAPRLGVIKPSPSTAVTAKASELRAAGVDVISLSVGESDFETPGHIVEAAIAAMKKAPQATVISETA
jgi:aspartate aminotransferase